MLGTQFGANLIPVVSRPPGLGRVYYVQIGGSDNNNGIDPGTPFLTLQHAIDVCVPSHNDYIYVLDCWNADIVTINIDCEMIHLIGLAQPTPGIWPQLSGGGTHDVFNLTANYCEIAGFAFASAGFAGISVNGADRCWIHHCNFGQTGNPLQDGIVGVAGDSPSHSLIEDCYFGSFLTRYGYSGNATNTTFRRNVFRDVHTIALNLGGVEIGAIYENYFYYKEADTPDVGWAITIVAGGNGGMIANNHAMQTGDGTGNNPYRDQSAAAIGALLNGWGMNYSGQAVRTPAL